MQNSLTPSNLEAFYTVTSSAQNLELIHYKYCKARDENLFTMRGGVAVECINPFNSITSNSGHISLLQQ